MDISKIFKDSHGMLDEKLLEPLHAMTRQQLKRFNIKKSSLAVICDTWNISIKDLYFDSDNQLYPFCYWDGLFYHGLLTLQEDVVLDTATEGDFQFGLGVQFCTMKQHFYELLQNEEWDAVVSYADKKVSLFVFEKLVDKIPVDERKNLFLSMYQRNEYGFERLNQQIVRDVLNLDTPDKYDIRQANVEPDEHGMLTIYRGVTPSSTQLPLAYSWTLNRNVAERFAHRFDSHGEVLTAKTHIDHVRAYLTGRNEAEVLVFPEYVILEK